MDFAKDKLNGLKDYLRKYLSFGDSKSVLEYEGLVKTTVFEGKTKKIWTEAFRTAINENEHVYIPAGEYYIDDTVIIPSNRKITADKKAFVCLTNGTKVVMFRTEHVIDGTRRLVTFDEPYSENIEIEGGIWATEYNCRAKYGKLGAFDNEDSMHGVHALMLFSGVKNLRISNAVCKNAATFAIQIGRAENFLIENVEFENCFADGVHLNGVIKNGVVFDVKGHTEDDLVALNAYDWDNSTINNGSMEDITISRIYSTGGECHCMRILAGVTAESMGSIGCSINNVHISYMSGVQTYKLYLQTPVYVGEPEGAKVGNIGNITFENISVEKDRPSDNGQNYYDKDLITGHFGVFEISSNIDKITFKNIDVKLNLPDYKDTAHFVTVGPKSWYLAEKNMEIFDPYVSSTINEIVYENVTVNGKKVEDISDYLKQVTFDKIYPSEYSSGSGEVKKITKIN